MGFYHDFLLFSAKYGGWAQKPAKIDQKNAIFWLSAQEKKKIYNSGRPPALGPRIAQEKKFFSPTQLYSAGMTTRTAPQSPQNINFLPNFLRIGPKNPIPPSFRR